MRRVFVLFGLALGACSAQQPPGLSSPAVDPAALEGCWVEHSNIVMTEQWSPHESGWRGFHQWWAHPDLTGGSPQPSVRYELRPVPSGYRLCREEYRDFRLVAGPQCFNAFFGPGHAIGEEADWAEFDVRPDHLRITLVQSNERNPLFDGERDSCGAPPDPEQLKSPE